MTLALLTPALAIADDQAPQQHNVTYRARVDGIARGALISYRISDTQVNSANPTMLPGRTFEALAIIRVFTKQPGKPPDPSSTPFTLPRGATVADLAVRIHKDLLANMTFARAWGAGVFPGQTVHRDHVLSDGDIVEIHE